MKKLFYFLVSFFFFVQAAFGQAPQFTYYTGPQDVASLQYYLNQLVTELNSYAGNNIRQFLPLAILQGTLSNPGGTMAGYVVGDTITLQCNDVTFVANGSPVIAVTQVSGGAVTGSTVVNGGITSSPSSVGAVSCSQASTSGSGTGYAVTANLGVIAATLSIPLLSTGGATGNESLVINNASANGFATTGGGGENLFFGDKAGLGLGGYSSFNTVIGAGAGGSGTGGSSVGANLNVFIGDDAGRNLTVANTSGNTLIGSGAGRNISAGNNTFVGYDVAGAGGINTGGLQSGAFNVAVGGNSVRNLTTGTDNTELGFDAGYTTTTGGSNICIGYFACNGTLTTGGSNIIIGPNQDALSASTSNEIDIGGLLFYNNVSTAAPAVAGGTSPTIDAHANNRSGTVTFGTGTVTSGTITFAGTGYATWAHCRVTPHSVVATFAYSYTVNAITITGTSLTSVVVDYDCDGY